MGVPYSLPRQGIDLHVDVVLVLFATNSAVVRRGLAEDVNLIGHKRRAVSALPLELHLATHMVGWGVGIVQTRVSSASRGCQYGSQA